MIWVIDTTAEAALRRRLYDVVKILERFGLVTRHEAVCELFIGYETCDDAVLSAMYSSQERDRTLQMLRLVGRECSCQIG